MRQAIGWIGGVSVCVAMTGCTWSRPNFVARTCAWAFYHPLNPLSFRRVNHRNHRRILVVDGRVGFTGGTGVGDKWAGDGRHAGRWRPTDVRVEGPIVRYLQSAFVENWRDATGLLLGDDAYFPPPEKRGEMRVQSVKSSPAAGAAEAFLLFLLAIEGARSSIHLTSPYFVPDRQIGDALVRAAQRGVDVSILTAGVVDTTLDRLVRKASQAHYGKPLAAGGKRSTSTRRRSCTRSRSWSTASG